jgi:hypothetical protein
MTGWELHGRMLDLGEARFQFGSADDPNEIQRAQDDHKGKDDPVQTGQFARTFRRHWNEDDKSGHWGAIHFGPAACFSWREYGSAVLARPGHRLA